MYSVSRGWASCFTRHFLKPKENNYINKNNKLLHSANKLFHHNLLLPSTSTCIRSYSVSPSVKGLSPTPVNIRNVLVVQKVSLLKNLSQPHANINLNINPNVSINPNSNLSAEYLKVDERLHIADKEHTLTKQKVIHALNDKSLAVKVVETVDLNNIQWADLVITVGGDGTFLRACQSMDAGCEKMILAVNSSPSSSFGFFAAADMHNFHQLLNDILTGYRSIRPLWRARAFVNDLPVGKLLLNEALFAAQSPAMTTRYVIRNGGVSQAQVSSGVWISTACGSTGAIHAAGGKVLALEDERLQYRVRELFTLSQIKSSTINSNSNTHSSHDQKINNSNLTANNNSGNSNNNNSGSNGSNFDLLQPNTFAPPSPKETIAAADTGLGHHYVTDKKDSKKHSNNQQASNHNVCSIYMDSSNININSTNNTSNPLPLLESGFLCDDFVLISRMQQGNLFLDGFAGAIPLTFGDRITFKRSPFPLPWISPTTNIHNPNDNQSLSNHNTQTVFTDTWQIVTGRQRPKPNE